jgi:hypothetical protein
MARGRWFESLECLFPIPAPYRREEVGRAGALDVLGCDDDLLTELVRRGLPCAGEPGAELFDQNDLFNLALYSGSGRSVPERAFRFALRWMRDSPASLLAPRLWSFSLESRCGESGGCGTDGRWEFALPAPELFEGAMYDLAIDPAGARAEGGTLECEHASAIRASGTVETRGEELRIVSPRLRRLIAEALSPPPRWIKVPEPLHAQPSLLLPSGVGTCAALSIQLERLCGEAGFEARTRQGWVLGMLDLVHAWLEVVDDDGRTKIVDPIFRLFFALTPAAHDAFGELCMGSRTNRLLPMQRHAGEPAERHWCRGGESATRRRTTILPTGVEAIRPAAAAAA